MPMQTARNDRAEQHEGVGAERLGDERGDAGAREPAERGPAADEAEDALGLPRVVDGVGQRPELTDQENREDQAEQVERNRHPFLAGLEQDPEQDQDPDERALRERNHPAPRQQRPSRARSPA